MHGGRFVDSLILAFERHHWQKHGAPLAKRLREPGRRY
jgi:hypothetical protein